MFDRRLIHNFDWGLLLVVLMLGGIGLSTVYSAVTADPPRRRTSCSSTSRSSGFRWGSSS